MNGYLPEIGDGGHWDFERLKAEIGSSLSDVDLRQYSSPRHNQRHIGSCVAQSTCKALEIKRIASGKEHIDLSVMALYYFTRMRMNPPQHKKDNGTYIWLAMDTLRKVGVARESSWPYDVNKVFKNPNGWSVARECAEHQISSYHKIRTVGEGKAEDVIRSLNAGHPVVFATKVGKDWFKNRGSVLSGESSPEGGHAMVLVGYKDGKFIVENSWGSSWGKNGFAYVTPEYLIKEFRDMFVLTAGYEPYAERVKVV